MRRRPLALGSSFYVDVHLSWTDRLSLAWSLFTGHDLEARVIVSGVRVCDADVTITHIASRHESASSRDE